MSLSSSPAEQGRAFARDIRTRTNRRLWPPDRFVTHRIARSGRSDRVSSVCQAPPLAGCADPTRIRPIQIATSASQQMIVPNPGPGFESPDVLPAAMQDAVKTQNASGVSRPTTTVRPILRLADRATLDMTGQPIATIATPKAMTMNRPAPLRLSSGL